MKYVYFFLYSLIFFSQTGPAQTLAQKQEKCFDKLTEELRSVLKEDPEFIQLQTTITAMKLSKEVLNRKNLKSQSLESYLENIVGPNTQNYMEKNKRKLNELYEKYGPTSEPQNAKGIFETLETKGWASDDDVRKLMITLEEVQPDSFSFEKEDYAIAWFLNESANTAGYNNNILSNVVKEILDFDVYHEKEFNDSEKKISKTLARSQAMLAGKLARVRAEVFTKYKNHCIDLFDRNGNDNSSNPSVFAACGRKDLEVVDQAFTEALLEIQEALIPKSLGLEEVMPLQNNNEKRKVQDEINGLSSDRERVIAFQQSALNQRRNLCEHYAIVDKKKFKTEIYNNNGDLITAIDSIVGSNRRDDKKFNPDASLQLFQNGTYTRTTTAGIFHVMAVGDERKKDDYYKEEFNNKVIVLGKEIHKNDEMRIEEEKILAIHGVPNAEWIGSDGRLKKLGNKNERMLAFEKNRDKKLSTGCVNLEAYTYDVFEELVHAECPIYILPEDQNNFMYVKNYQMNFSTSSKDKYLGKEHSQILKEGNLIADENNYNKYNFTAPSKKILFKEISGLEFENKKEIISKSKEVFKNYPELESDDLELSLSLVLVQDLKGEEAISELKKIYEKLKENKFNMKFQLLSTQAKKEEVLSHINSHEREKLIEDSKKVVFK